ncbi:AAA family ATPase [Devosia alba]|uniref:AAA family ATPase n=1 Tax=Devosia alba TaxID=3152360 RepID=UPI003267D638
MSISEIFPETKTPDQGELLAVRYAIVTSDRPIAKRFTAVGGKPSKRSGDAPLVSGTAETFKLAGSASEMAAGLAADLEGLDVSQVLICVPPPREKNTWPLVVDDKVEGTAGAISRTKKYFKTPDGPGILPLDFDVKEYPSHITAKLDGQTLRAPLEAVFPEFARAADVSRPSMSTGIRHKGTGQATSSTAGLHRYCFVRDGQDVPRFSQVLKDRLVLNGWGWAHVTASGRILIKTLIDVMASIDQSRVWYEGQAILESSDLEFIPGARAPIVRDGGFLDTSLLPDLTSAERDELKRIEDDLRAGKADEAERTRLEHMQLLRGKVPALTPSKFTAFSEDHDCAVEKLVLQGDYPIVLDDGRVVTAREISQAPGRYDGLTCPDPLEPEYGAGRNLAIILNGGGDTRIESQAHGGMTYSIRMKVSDVWESVEDPVKEKEGDRVIMPSPFVWRDPSTIQPREWLYGGHYLRKFISATVAPGSLGKSSLSMVENLAMATKRPLLGVMPHGRFKTWIWNGEDPYEEVERRVHGAMLYYGIAPAELEGRFYFDSGRSTPITVATQTKDGATIHAPDVKAIKQGVRARGVDVLTIDPFISSHRVTENDNDAMSLVARTWAQIADELNISIELVHHARKLGGKEVTAEDARGGGALVDAARAVRTLTRPSKEEMRSLGLEGDPRTYFRFGQGKDNLTAPASKNTKWMALRSQHLGNATPEYTEGDSVGVVAEYTPTAVSKIVEGDQTRAILDILSSGEYLDSANSRDRWAGSVVAGVLGLEISDPEDRQEVLAVLKSMKGSGLIKAVHRTDPTTRKPRQYIQVTPATEARSNV